MAEWFDKLKNMIMGEPDDYDEDYENEYDEDDEYEEEAPRASKAGGFASSYRTTSGSSSAGRSSSRTRSSSYGSYGSSSSRVLSINTSVNMQVVVAAPTNLEEAGDACEELKDKKTVVVNLEGLDRDIAQRITDFFCGACYSLDGTIQPISNRIFIIGPYDVKLTGQFKQELEASGIKLPNSSMWR